MTKALVTGCAGFIGSHLTESLLEDGHSVLGVDCFNDNYRRSDKRANLRRARDHDGFRLIEGDLVEARRRAAARGVRRRLPPRRRARRARQLGSALRPLHAPQRRPPPSGCWRRRARSPAGASSTRPRPRSTATRCALPTREDVTPQPLSPYGVTKLAAEHLCVLYHEEHGGRHGRAALLLRLRPAPAAGHGVPALLRGDRSPAGRSSCSATAARRATSPTWPTSWPRPARPARARRDGVLQRRRRLAGEPQPRARAARRRSPGARWTCAAASASPATCSTPARTSRAPARCSASTPRRASRTGCGPSSSGSATGSRHFVAFRPPEPPRSSRLGTPCWSRKRGLDCVSR